MLLNPGSSLIPIIGTGVLYRDTGIRLHRVPDRILGKGLQLDLDFVAEDSPWWACVAFSNGRIAFIPSVSDLTPLPEDWREKMIELAIMANRELHHGGHWVIAAADGALSALWRDADGDMQTENTFNEGWARIKAKPREEWIDVLDACWHEAERRLRALRDPRVQFLRAQGQASKGRPAR